MLLSGTQLYKLGTFWNIKYLRFDSKYLRGRAGHTGTKVFILDTYVPGKLTKKILGTSEVPKIWFQVFQGKAATQVHNNLDTFSPVKVFKKILLSGT